MKRFTYFLMSQLCGAGLLFSSFETFEVKAERAHLDLSKGWIEVNIPKQKINLWKGRDLVCSYGVSTAKCGVGEIEGSAKTPLGLHCIHRKVGENAPLYAIFRYLKKAPKDWDPSQDSAGQDLILTRVITLKGLEKGFNEGYNRKKQCVDSLHRAIYIHGTAEENLIGTPASHGCIRLRNADILVFFDRVEVGMPVWIHNDNDFHP